MRLALAQMSLSDDMDSNLDKTIDFIRKASVNCADLVLFPEIHLTEFFPKHRLLDKDEFAVSLDSVYVAKLCDACRKYGVYASPNFYIVVEGHYYDMSLLIDDKGSIIGNQKMVHIAQADYFFEQDYYDGSDDGFKVFDTVFGKIGIVVCFDRHYPESIRTESLMGADLILIPTANTTLENSELFMWEVCVQAFHNCVNIAMCNRVGVEDSVCYCGQSLVCDCSGRILVCAESDEKIVYCDIDLNSVKDKKSSSNYLNIRRKEFYL